MNSSDKKYPSGVKGFVAILILGMVVHFSITLIYVFRDQVPMSVNRYTDRYMAPVFHQNWKLFAPDLPKYNCELEYRMAYQNEWSDWQDVSSSYGYNDYSLLETIEQNILTQLNWQILNNLYSRNGEQQFDRIVSSTAYTDAMFMVMKMYRNANPGKKEEMMQVRIKYRFTPAPGENTLPEEIIEFPIYAGESPS